MITRRRGGRVVSVSKLIYNRTKEKVLDHLDPVEGQTMKILLLCPYVILLSTAHTDKLYIIYYIISFTTLS